MEGLQVLRALVRAQVVVAQEPQEKASLVQTYRVAMAVQESILTLLGLQQPLLAILVITPEVEEGLTQAVLRLLPVE